MNPTPVMPKLSKRLASLVTKIEDRAYQPLEAIQLVKELSLIHI